MIPNNITQLLQSIGVNMNEIKGIKTPNDFAQYLLNTGRVNQYQVNQAKQMWDKQMNK
jgi:hypothetical protein